MTSSATKAGNIIFRQLFEKSSSTYTYIVGCRRTGKALIIDPVLETNERDATLLRELELDPVIAINTHVHADHITGTGRLKKQHFPNMRSVLSRVSGGKADVFVDHGQVIHVGDGVRMEVRSTPGHTNGCITLVCHEIAAAFTGDTLLIRGCGRTDFQQGSSKGLYQSVHQQIFTLPDHYSIFPAHNYDGIMQSSVAEERAHNRRLTKSEADFVDLMQNLKLAYPKQIDRALPANLECGMGEYPRADDKS